MSTPAHGRRPFVIMPGFRSKMHQIVRHCIAIGAGSTVPEESDTDRDRNTDDDDAEYDKEELLLSHEFSVCLDEDKERGQVVPARTTIGSYYSTCEMV